MGADQEGNTWTILTVRPDGWEVRRHETKELAAIAYHNGMDADGVVGMYLYEPTGKLNLAISVWTPKAEA